MTKILYEIFCGTKSFSMVAKDMGYECITLDIEDKFEPTICMDFEDFDYKTIKEIDHVHFSPDCSCYSLASGGYHFGIDRIPKTEKARKSLRMIEKIKKMIYWLMYNVNPKITYTIENPRARMRWFITEFPRKSVCYCKYGHQNMKPTDIWTNIDFPAKFCKNNNPDCNHVRAPRGSKNGTQGITREERYIIPTLLIKEILENRNE